jgi:hypothetical protein
VYGAMGVCFLKTCLKVALLFGWCKVFAYAYADISIFKGLCLYFWMPISCNYLGLLGVCFYARMEHHSSVDDWGSFRSKRETKWS